MKNIKKYILSIGIMILFISSMFSIILLNKHNHKISCLNNARSFLLWYKANFLEISKAQNKIIDLNSKEYYIPKYSKIDSYVFLLQSSNYFSDIFIDKFKRYLVSNADTLLKSKQNDGPPEGFDYDFFFGQEYDYYLQLIPDKIEIKILKNDKEVKKILVAGYIEYTFDESCKIKDIGRNGESFY